MDRLRSFRPDVVVLDLVVVKSVQGRVLDARIRAGLPKTWTSPWRSHSAGTASRTSRCCGVSRLSSARPDRRPRRLRRDGAGRRSGSFRLMRSSIRLWRIDRSPCEAGTQLRSRYQGFGGGGAQEDVAALVLPSGHGALLLELVDGSFDPRLEVPRRGCAARCRRRRRSPPPPAGGPQRPRDTGCATRWRSPFCAPTWT